MRRNIGLMLGILLCVCMEGCARQVDQDADGFITLHVADWGGASSDPAMSRFEQDIKAEWERTHPRIRIVPEHIPGSDEYVSKLLTAFVARTEPDVMSLDASSAAVFIDNDTLVDLTPFVKADHLDLSVYYPNVLSLAQRGDHLYALPADFTPMMVYFNRKRFDEAGLSYPHEGWTWEEFREDCKHLTVWPAGAAHPERYGFQLQNWMPGWIMWIWQNGGDVLTQDGRHATGALDSTETVKAVQFFTDLMKKDHVAPSLSENQSHGDDPFQSGLTAMQISGHWNLVGLKASEKIKLSDVGVVGLPQNKQRVTVIYESGYAMTKDCKHPREAWEYIKFMSGPFVQQKKAELGIGISANRKIAEARRHSSPLEPVFLDNVMYGRIPWGARVENYAQVEDLGKEMLDEILVGDVSVTQALQAAARRMDARLGIH